jgi:hypothetical protein
MCLPIYEMTFNKSYHKFMANQVNSKNIILLHFKIYMFGFGDMAMGSAMEMNGAMDMADGMMLTEMGMPGLGAAEMGIGAM